MTGLPLREAVAACEKIASGNNSTLFHAARLLPRHRRDVFSVAYAAMRVIDDAVDEEFLTLPEAERNRTRAAMLDKVEAWRLHTAEGVGQGTLPEAVARGFELVVRPSDMGPGPWNGLAEALKEDVAEAPMDDWAAFERYAEGATVAPAIIFIYLLACREIPGGLSHGLPRPSRYYAADLGVFCYLVHILRDLAKDVGAAGPDAPGPRLAQRLITIPTEALTKAGLTRETLAEAVGAKGDARVDLLAADILARAEIRRKAGRARLSELSPLLGPREKAAIEALVQVYERLHRDFKKDYAQRLQTLPDLEEPIRRDIMGP